MAARESIAVGQRPLPMASAELFHCGDERRVSGDLVKSDA